MGFRRKISAETSPRDLPLSAPVGAALAPAAPPAIGWMRGLGIVSVGLALAAPLVSLGLLFPLVEDIPKWDQWSLIEVWDAHYTGKPVLPLLVEPYNGHLNFAPRFVFYALGAATQWNVRAEVLASYGMAAITLCILLAWIPRQLRTLLAAAVAAQVFSFLQWENFLSGYPFGQVLSQALAVLTIACLNSSRVSAIRFAAAFAAAAAATFSWGAGLAVWPVGLGMLVAARAQRSFAIFWGCATLACVLVVGWGSRGAFPLALVDVPAFFLVVLGRAWVPYEPLQLRSTLLIGGLALVLFCALTLRAWPERDRRDRIADQRPWIALGCLTLLSAALIAWGRAGAGMEQSRASHYVTATYPLIVACLVLAARPARRPGAENEPPARLKTAGLAWCLAMFALVQPIAISLNLLPDLRTWATIHGQHTDRLLRGVASDDEIQFSHHPRPDRVRWGMEVLCQHELGPFRHRASHRLVATAAFSGTPPVEGRCKFDWRPGERGGPLLR